MAMQNIRNRFVAAFGAAAMVFGAIATPSLTYAQSGWGDSDLPGLTDPSFNQVPEPKKICEGDLWGCAKDVWCIFFCKVECDLKCIDNWRKADKMREELNRQKAAVPPKR
jgi:hypothetical protein